MRRGGVPKALWGVLCGYLAANAAFFALCLALFLMKGGCNG